MRKKEKLYIGILIAVLFFTWLATWRFNRQVATPITTPYPLLHKEGVQEGSVTVSTGNETIHFEPNQIFYDALIKQKNAGKITLSGKNYPGLGFFVTNIGPLHSGGGKNLLYYINGKEATVGVSSYTLKDNDVIEWKLE